MKSIYITPTDEIDIDEFVKSICFVSSAITSVQKTENQIKVEIDKNGDSNIIHKELLQIMKKYKKINSYHEVYFNNHIENRKYYDLVCDHKEILFWGEGQVGFGEKGKFLFEYFDELFGKIAYQLGAIEKMYPALLPIGGYSKTGYLKKTPQYAIFCSTVNDSINNLEQTDVAIRNRNVKEIVKEPEYALSPSACFHTYIEYENSSLEKNTIITFRQNVFRNEGRLNYRELGRLCDYHVREIVMIGSSEYVIKMRNQIMEKSTEIMKNVNLDGDISLASDSFVVPKMQMYRKIQRVDKSKYEMHLKVSDNKTISTASFNLHGRAFTDPFNISVDNCEDTVTACVGFGLQRWVIAFLSQYSLEERKWPLQVKEKYYSYIEQKKFC